jgi:hypothetical protein
MSQTNGQDAVREHQERLRVIVMERAMQFTAEELRRMMKGMGETDCVPFQLQPLPLRGYGLDISIVYHAVSSVCHAKSQTSVTVTPAPAAVGIVATSTVHTEHELAASPASESDIDTFLETGLAPQFRVLCRFGLLCSPRTREEVVDLALGDIKRMARTERTVGASERWVRFLVRWHIARCIGSVWTDCSARLIRRCSPLLQLLARYWRPT